MVSITKPTSISPAPTLAGPPLAAADKLLRTITQTTSLPCFRRLAATRLVAKVASDQANHAASCGFHRSEQRFLATLPVRKIPDRRNRRSARYAPWALKPVEQLAAMHRKNLKAFSPMGHGLYRKSRAAIPTNL